MFNYLRKITNNPLLILGLVIIVIILLIRECQRSNAEGFNPGDPTNATALATTVQLAQKFNKAMSIDNEGNVTFKKNVTNNGTVTNKGTLNNKGTINSLIFNQRNADGQLKSQLHDGRVLGRYAIFGPMNNGRQTTKFTIHENGNFTGGIFEGKLAGNPTLNNLFCPPGYRRRFYNTRTTGPGGNGRNSWFCGKDNSSQACYVRGPGGSWGNPRCDDAFPVPV